MVLLSPHPIRATRQSRSYRLGAFPSLCSKRVLQQPPDGFRLRRYPFFLTIRGNVVPHAGGESDGFPLRRIIGALGHHGIVATAPTAPQTLLCGTRLVHIR